MRNKLTKREYRLIRDGFFWDDKEYYYKEDAKERAKELRKDNSRAVVVTYTPRNCATKYLVYYKEV